MQWDPQSVLMSPQKSKIYVLSCKYCLIDARKCIGSCLDYINWLISYIHNKILYVIVYCKIALLLFFFNKQKPVCYLQAKSANDNLFHQWWDLDGRKPGLVGPMSKKSLRKHFKEQKSELTKMHHKCTQGTVHRALFLFTSRNIERGCSGLWEEDS